MSDIYYFAFLSSSINEGGMARNNAFFLKFNSFTKNIFNVYHENALVRRLSFFRYFFLLLFLRKKKIFIHQGSILALFPILLFHFKIVRKAIQWFLIFLSKNNRLFIEINDLPYEQAIDLQLKINEDFLIFENILYSLKNVNYVFASHQMEEFVRAKYNIPSSFTQVIINGGPALNKDNFIFEHEVFNQKNKIKYVYAGSLNEGRNIRDIISFFENKHKHLLILIGNDGDWLSDTLLPENINYLGNFDEDKAHKITALCDIGLLPYDSSRFYYNLCYPTKVSFYITAGIPVLSTPLKELYDVFGSEKMVEFIPFSDWGDYMHSITNEKIIEMKKEVEKQKNRFNWSSILESLHV